MNIPYKGSLELALWLLRKMYIKYWFQFKMRGSAVISGTYFTGISSSHLDHYIVSIMPLASTSIENKSTFLRDIPFKYVRNQNLTL